MTDTDRHPIVRTVEDLYAAVGRDDRAALGEILHTDFHAFESGVRMSSAELLDLMTKALAAGKRYRWSVTEEQVRVAGDLGVITYVNRGSVAESPDSEPVAVTWLETVILCRVQSRWRVAFLHSNRTRTDGPAPGAA
jgi:hypothetical protein